MNNQQIKETIDKIIMFLTDLKAEIDTVKETQVDNQPKSEFETLKVLLESNEWPNAANPNLICDPESKIDKIERGNGILELIVEEPTLENKKFLDFGCGDGYVASKAVTSPNSAILSVGYDIVEYSSWNELKSEKVIFSKDWEEIKAKGPYDIIMCFDMLDHIENESIVDALKKMASVLTPTGYIYARMHPWTSRHAIHQYHECNKAFMQLVFTPEELKQLYPQTKYMVPNVGVRRPLFVYEDYIRLAGLKMSHEPRSVQEKVEEFFKSELIAKRIFENTGIGGFPENEMSYSFVDYKLELIKKD